LDFVLSIVQAIAGLPPPLLYLVILVWLAFESAGTPLPNEAVLLFAGYLVAIGHLQLPIAWIAATLGSLAGATFSWWIAKRYGKAGVRRVGRYIFLDDVRVAAAEAWFRRWGSYAIFLARLTPVVRTVVSYPAGLARMNYRPFALATIAGAAIWCLLALFVGRAAGEHWTELFERIHTPALVFGVLIVLALVAYVVLEHAMKRRFARSQ
jgi:membrane protein DedA with SNARE-associated domain